MKNRKIRCPHCGTYFLLSKEKQNATEEKRNIQHKKMESSPEDLLDLMQDLPPKEVAKLCGISKKEMRKINQVFADHVHWGSEQERKEECS